MAIIAPWVASAASSTSSATVVRVGVYDNAPKVYKGGDGTWTGFWPELVNYIASKEGWTVEYVEGTWNECMARLEAGEIDVMVDVAHSKERNALYDFNTLTVFSNWGVIYAGEPGIIFSFDDLNNKTIAVMNGSIHTHGPYGIMNMTLHFGINCTYVMATDYTEVFKMVENKTVDAGVVNRLFGMLNQGNYSVVQTSLILNPVDLKLAFPKGAARNALLLPRFDHHLAALQADPQSLYYQLIERFFMAIPVVERVPEWLVVVIITISAGVAISISMSAYLKRIVNQKSAIIHERDRIEDSLRETMEDNDVEKHRAEESDRLKSAFLATMSHELRTPLNSIIGFTGILQAEMAGPLNDEQKKQLGMVRGSATHLLNLINDVLDISKIEAGQIEIVKEPFDLPAVIDRVVEGVRPLIEKKGLALETEIQGDAPVITSDQRRVEQVTLNLLSNAIKFTEAGKVRVECTVNETVVIRVIDTGIGIKDSDMDKLFKPFRQIDTALTRKYEGTGLGLSICQRLARLLGGTITVASEFGQGSTFTFTIPRGS